MEFLDARRLTGPNLLWNHPGSIMDIRCTRDDAKRLIPLWNAHVRRILAQVGWGQESTTSWLLSGGVSLAFPAPIDALYAATAINELAWACCRADLYGAPAQDFQSQLNHIREMISEEKNSSLIALDKAVRTHGVSLLWDDDAVSIGHGAGSQTWPFRELPDVESLDWNRYYDIPIGIVTGTNGKTTTVRLAQRILKCAGHTVGISSTESIAVNDDIVDRGDWSGPGGARQVLRQSKVNAAILETARGGLLRRGLGVDKADVALITNISEDHLGDFGSQSLEELLNIKWVVTRAVESQGTLVLNADDELLVKKSVEFPGTIIWFSLNAENRQVIQHVSDGGISYVLEGDHLVRLSGEYQETICDAREIPITMSGAARHNVANALAAAAISETLGANIEDIRRGLLSMSQDNNPGRANMYTVDGTKVLVDFAHNPAAMQALFDLAQVLPAKRRLLAFGQAGDRPDDLIRELARRAWAIGLDRIIVSELSNYHRGRSHGEVYTVIRDELITCGADHGQIQHFDEESDSLNAALEWAEPGDLIIMLALGSSARIQQTLRALQ